MASPSVSAGTGGLVRRRKGKAEKLYPLIYTDDTDRRNAQITATILVLNQRLSVQSFISAISGSEGVSPIAICTVFQSN
jgi:hypothetical protein